MIQIFRGIYKSCFIDMQAYFIGKGTQRRGNFMSKFAGIQVGLMQLRHIDFRLTVTAQIVELNPFHVCTTHSQCSVIFSTELLFCKKQIFSS